MMQIRWVDKIYQFGPPVKVLKRVEEKRKLWKCIVCKRDTLIKHNQLRPGLLVMLMVGKINGTLV